MANLSLEDRIVWEEPISDLPYVRVSHVVAGTRRLPVRWNAAGRRVGYAVLHRDAPNDGLPGMFTRRVFWIAEHDRSEDPEGVYKAGAPTEAVDPWTVGPGVEGELTDRAWGE